MCLSHFIVESYWIGLCIPFSTANSWYTVVVYYIAKWSVTTQTYTYFLNSWSWCCHCLRNLDVYICVWRPPTTSCQQGEIINEALRWHHWCFMNWKLFGKRQRGTIRFKHQEPLQAWHMNIILSNQWSNEFLTGLSFCYMNSLHISYL